MNKLVLILLMAPRPNLWASDRFVLDPEHTFPSFEIRHRRCRSLRGQVQPQPRPGGARCAEIRRAA